MGPIKTAVIGAGYLGKYHAEKYAHLPTAELVAVCDINTEQNQTLARQLQTQALSDYHLLIGLVDAVSIAVPTPLHYTIGKFFLENGIHVLLEKPITDNISQAEELISIAKQQQVILQVGHLEQFNPVICALPSLLDRPLFIEARRLAPFKLRGSDVSVILDLMIHDIDIIQSIVQANIAHIHAHGAKVLSPLLDIAKARIEFTNGCVANLTASRIHPKTERRLQIFQAENYLDLDLDQKTLGVHRKNKASLSPEIMTDTLSFDPSDALKEQIMAFLNCIISDKQPAVNGERAKKALVTALHINQLAEQQFHYTMTQQQPMITV